MKTLMRILKSKMMISIIIKVIKLRTCVKLMKMLIVLMMNKMISINKKLLYNISLKILLQTWSIVIDLEVVYDKKQKNNQLKKN